MRTKLIIISVLFLLFAILASQNTASTQLNFFFWNITAPLIVMIVVIFILGLVIGIFISSSYEKKKQTEETNSLKSESSES